MNRIEKSDIADHYEIHLEGYLHKYWEEWFDGMSIAHLENGMTLLSGSVADQSALHGILSRLCDMKFKLISVHKA